MTQSVEFKLSGQLDAALLDPATRTLNADKLVGHWVNTSRETQGLSEISIERDGDGFFVSAAGVGGEGPVAWPRTSATALANLEEEAGQRALALAVNFDFGFMKAETYLRVNKGVLVIVAYYAFADGDSRSNYVNREFFYRRD